MKTSLIALALLVASCANASGLWRELSVDSIPQELAHVIDMKIMGDTLWLSYETHSGMGQRFLKAYTIDYQCDSLKYIGEPCRRDDGYYHSYMPYVFTMPDGAPGLVSQDECALFSIADNLSVKPMRKYVIDSGMNMPFPLTSYVGDIFALADERYIFTAREPAGGAVWAMTTDFSTNKISPVRRLAHLPDEISWVANTGELACWPSKSICAYAYKLYPCIDFFTTAGDTIASVQVASETFDPATLVEADAEDSNILHFIDTAQSSDRLYALYWGKTYADMRKDSDRGSAKSRLFQFDLQGNLLNVKELPGQIYKIAVDSHRNRIVAFDVSLCGISRVNNHSYLLFLHKKDDTGRRDTGGIAQFRERGATPDLCRFFKTGKGEYGEGDRFLGLKVPQTRAVVRHARLQVPFAEISKLLSSEYHEARLAGFLLLVEEMSAALPKRRKVQPESAARRREIARFYLESGHRANNWDLVDLSAPYILGQYLLHEPEQRGVLDKLAASSNLWENRIAIVSTAALIRAGQFEDTLHIASLLLSHPHDLIHKAVGWMLREVGKRDIDVLHDYLEANSHAMARTTLRYSIERMSPSERKHWLTR